jgi:N-acetylglucosaminyldiphosphoundecaprenol N-acetyl-beta-D-mannosaminyltransferase
MATVSCVGVPITACTPAEAAHEVVLRATAEPPQGADVHLCNAYTLALADADPAFKSMLTAAELNFPDGKAVVWANRLTHRRADLPSERVYGPDLFLDVFRLGEERGLRHYLLGSTSEVLADLEAELRRLHPDVRIVGTESPPFRAATEAEAEAQIERLAAARAQVVWVGLGTPKQDWEAARLAQRVPAVFCAVGAAFDFVAGHKSQAPRWMQDRGLEWLFRLASEPRRLWRRYLFGNARFVWSVAKTLRSPR